MKAFFVGKAVNIEHYISDFWEESLRVSSMKEMDWERYESTDVIFCVYGEFEKPESVEDVISVQLFNSDQAQEISLKNIVMPHEFYLPFECDQQDVEQLQVMLMGVLKKENLDDDVKEVKEEIEKNGPIVDEEEDDSGLDIGGAEIFAFDADEENELDNLDIENIDLEVGDDEELETNIDLDVDQEELEMSDKDDELDMELTDEEIDLGDDTDIDLDEDLTSDVVDIDFGSDDEIEIDEESSGIFMSQGGEDEDEELDVSEVSLEFGEDDEEEHESSIDLSAGEDDLEELDSMDGTGDFDLASAEIDIDEDEDVLDFSAGEDDEENEIDSLEVEDEDGLTIDLSGENDETIDFSTEEDEETDRTLIANDLDALKAEAKARRDAGESSDDNEDIVTEDGFVLETGDDEYEEGETGEFQPDLSGTSEDLDFSLDGESGENTHVEMTFSKGGIEDESHHADENDMEFSLDGEEDEDDFQLGGDDSGELDLSGGAVEMDLPGGSEGVETITQFQSEEPGAADESEFSIDEEDDDIGIDFGGDRHSETQDSTVDHYSEPPMVSESEVLNFGGISDEKDLLNMQSTIREIREERQEFLGRIQEFERVNKELRQENLTLKAELDEKRIELSVIQKRQVSDRDDVREKLRSSEEKKLLFEEKLKRIQREYEKLEQKVHIDVEKIRKRERELENQLELVKMDAQSQIKSRDSKIMDLKRKIDSLEFNVKTSSNREQKNLEEKLRLESRLEKVMDQLKGSIRTLEEEVSVEDLKKLESH